MKRYWNSIFLCFLAMFVIGTFYIQTGFADQSDIQIEFKKVKGNENEVKDLILYGDYAVGNLYQSLQITSEETIDLSHPSFMQRMSADRFAPILQDLIKQHKNFFRGKELIPSNFYENESLLVYAGLKGDSNQFPMSNITFNIQVLNKRSGETFEFQSNVPKKEKYQFMNMEDVQVVKDELKLFVRGFGNNGGEDFLVYTFDMDEQKLVKNDTIVSNQRSENRWTDIRIINDFNSIQTQNHYLFFTETYEAQGVHGNGQTITYEGEPKLVGREAFIYNIEKDQLKKIEIPNEWNQSSESFSMYGSDIFVHTPSANGIEVNQYDMEKEEWGNKLTFETSLSEEMKAQPYIKFMNGKVYFIRSTSIGHTIFIGDVKTGESLYEGKLKVINKKENQKEYQLYFREIEFH